MVNFHFEWSRLRGSNALKETAIDQGFRLGASPYGLPSYCIWSKMLEQFLPRVQLYSGRYF